MFGRHAASKRGRATRKGSRAVKQREAVRLEKEVGRLSRERGRAARGGGRAAKQKRPGGFPSFLNVDEFMLRRAFLPFGEIDKITSFPGRSYAFVRYRSIVSACRAKEALQGKLFNNPRVNICFARSDMQTEHAKGPENGPFPQQFRPKFFAASSEQDFEPFYGDEGFESPIQEFQRISPPFRSNLDRARGDMHAGELSRNNSSRFGADGYENMRSREFVPERRSEDIFERQRTSPEERTPPWRILQYERPQRVPPFVDSWATEDRSFPLAKKHKVDILPDKDLPEYPFSDLEQDKHEIQRKPFPDFPEHHGYNKPMGSVPFSLKGPHDFSRTLSHPHSETDESWNNVSRLNVGSRPVPNNSPKLHRSNPEPTKPSRHGEMWKWEGAIAKGGTQVCRARCFPVGKVLDFMLPEFLNCTARTGLDMLAKHYYQAVGTWVVFFVPESDADIAFYNEFMNYLGEKQRAAVAKLGEKVTLFLVPPSDFSEQVLKVPGKVSISGVILKFQQNASNFSSLHHPINSMETKAPPLPIHEGASFLKPKSPDFRPNQNHRASSSGFLTQGTFPPPAPKLDDKFPYSTPAAHGGIHINYDPPPQPNWPNNKPNSTPLQAFGRSFSKEFLSVNSRAVNQGTDSSGYMPETLPSSSSDQFPPQQEIKHPAPPVTSTPLHPEQLAQLAAILGNQNQSREQPPLPNDERGKFSHNPTSQAHASTMYSNSSLPAAAEGHHVGRAPQAQLQREPQQHDSSPAQKSSREDVEADPEKRLQATLQLAAALLQQIQQRSKPVD
ncbi:Flowering time control protein FPA [Platanthera zijinensis]|uniref:Flowering time control protein FPA n=1 Tax=Platanthera zijinensis TaxID=2320716 RepID=A0AAP0BF46_9ASPA